MHHFRIHRPRIPPETVPAAGKHVTYGAFQTGLAIAGLTPFALPAAWQADVGAFSHDERLGLGQHLGVIDGQLLRVGLVLLKLRRAS